jgi:hypothetical protein
MYALLATRTLADLIESKARQFYLGDKSCPLADEPSGRIFSLPVSAKPT